MKRTRFAELAYRCAFPGLWRFVDRSTSADVGPAYAGERELLADLDRYAALFGCAA